MKQFFIVTLVFMLIAGLAAAADQKAEKQSLPLDLDQQIWFFGMIPRDAVVCHHYPLTNNQPEAVTIIEIISDCDCTKTPKTPITIAPGDTYPLKIQFDTKTYFGETNRDIRLITDHEPNPEMTVFFTSLAARLPNTVTVFPRMTAFIPGKDDQEFIIENLTNEKTEFKVFVDYDSVFTLTESSFTLKGGQKKVLGVSPLWDKIPQGSHFSCLVVEVGRKEKFSFSIPIKINKF